MTRWLRCRDCDTPLTNEDSQRLGYGRSCAEKRGLVRPRKPRRARAVRRPKPANVPNPPDVPPGQDAIPLFYFEPTLDSL